AANDAADGGDDEDGGLASGRTRDSSAGAGCGRERGDDDGGAAAECCCWSWCCSCCPAAAGVEGDTRPPALLGNLRRLYALRRPRMEDSGIVALRSGSFVTGLRIGERRPSKGRSPGVRKRHQGRLEHRKPRPWVVFTIVASREQSFLR